MIIFPTYIKSSTMPRGECGFEFNANKKKTTNTCNSWASAFNTIYALHSRGITKNVTKTQNTFLLEFQVQTVDEVVHQCSAPTSKIDLTDFWCFFFTNNSFNTAALSKKGAPSSVMIVNWMVSPSFIYLNLDIKPQCECS